jgi:hypothetical protein
LELPTISVVDRHRVGAAPDPDLDSGLASKQPLADFTPSLHMLENREIFLLSFPAMPVSNVFLF